ncbi:hypothetical protein RND81_11G156300 [Saponaria officinalis]|uniref:CCHC-type domain-containing protein n=1 Tax=Saponaria officinalis TaxID=3572 RepID=A0AAW1HNK7_SAPOF
MVMKWILNSIDRHIRDTLQYASSSKELWTEIIDRYGQPNSLEIYQLKKELASMSQENLSLVDYYGKLKRSWEHIDSLDPLPLCTCGALNACTCHLLKRILDRETSAKLIQFLMGLSDTFEHVKTHVLSMDPLPPFNKTLGLLHKIETQKQIHTASDAFTSDTATYNTVRSKASTGTYKKVKFDHSVAQTEVKECGYCHHLGHTKNECYKFRECSFCGRKGHAKDNCFQLHPDLLTRSSKSSKRSAFKDKIAPRHYKRTSHNADVQPSSDATDAYYASDPLSDVPADQSSGGAYDAQFVGGAYDAHFVSTVVSQVMKAISDKSPPLSSVNFVDGVDELTGEDTVLVEPDD